MRTVTVKGRETIFITCDVGSKPDRIFHRQARCVQAIFALLRHSSAFFEHLPSTSSFRFLPLASSLLSSAVLSGINSIQNPQHVADHRAYKRLRSASCSAPSTRGEDPYAERPGRKLCGNRRTRTAHCQFRWRMFCSVSRYSWVLTRCLLLADVIKNPELEVPLQGGTGSDDPVDRQAAKRAAFGQVEGSAAGSRGRNPGPGRRGTGGRIKSRQK